jgi:3-oxoacyl-[acyl-carrier protein] reductase
VPAQAVWFDLAETAAQDRLAQAAWDWQGAVDIWVNNAGVDTLTGPSARRSFEEKLDALWHVDVTATLRLSRDIGARMKARGQGVIVNIGWDQAESGMAGDSGELFAATKGAVMAFTRSLAASLAPQVRVNCIAPGWIKTAWGEHASATWQERAVRESLRGRWGTPEDVAAAARFLASPAADFITSQILHVNGGWRRGAE